VASSGPALGRADLILRRALLLAAILGVVACGSAPAGAIELSSGEVKAKFDARFSPARLSPSEWAPLSPWVSMSFKNPEGTETPALKEFKIEEDRHLRLNLKGVPVCSHGTIDEPPITQRCRKALIGRGEMGTYIFYSEGVPIVANTEVTVYNAGLRNGVRTLFLATFITIPTPKQIVTKVEVKHSSLGRYGLKLVGSVPKVAGGAGSVISLAWRFHKDVFSAICPLDQHLDTRFTSTLLDGTTLGGTVVRDCAPAP
jgi:hypothetical protein